MDSSDVKSSQEENGFIVGYIAGKAGNPRANSYVEGSKNYRAYENGWCAGTAHKARLDYRK